MEFKNLLLAGCLLVSLAGLAFVYFSMKNISSEELKISNIDSSLTGKAVSIKGKIIYAKSHPSGHVFLTLADGDSKIQVPIFSSLMDNLNDNGITKYDFKKGRILKVEGIVGEYKGQLQVVPRKVADIHLSDS